MKGPSLGIAAGLLFAGGAALPLAPAADARQAPATAFFDTVVLLRWGHGALDWLLPDPPRGDAHVHDRDPRR